MDIFQVNYISLFIIFFIPGFISVKVWGFIVPTKIRNMNEDLFEVISYSCINFALTSWLIIIIGNDTFQSNHPILFVVLFFLPTFAPAFGSLHLYGTDIGTADND